MRSQDASLAARARRAAGAAALQARIAVRRDEETRARRRAIATAGAAAGAMGLVCAAIGLVALMGPDLLEPWSGAVAAAAAILFGLGPVALLAAAALGHLSADDDSATAIGSAKMLADLGADFGGAIGGIDGAAQPEVARALGTLLGVLEIAAANLMRSERPAAAAVAARRHQRIVPLSRRVVVRTADGRKLIGTIEDVSLSGVALTGSLPRVSVGDAATVGTRKAIVARLWDRGIAFQFERELDPATFDEAVVL